MRQRRKRGSSISEPEGESTTALETLLSGALCRSAGFFCLDPMGSAYQPPGPSESLTFEGDRYEVQHSVLHYDPAGKETLELDIASTDPAPFIDRVISESIAGVQFGNSVTYSPIAALEEFDIVRASPGQPARRVTGIVADPALEPDKWFLFSQPPQLAEWEPMVTAADPYAMEFDTLTWKIRHDFSMGIGYADRPVAWRFPFEVEAAVKPWRGY